jgi:hypothetical protein
MSVGIIVTGPSVRNTLGPIFPRMFKVFEEFLSLRHGAHLSGFVTRIKEAELWNIDPDHALNCQ